MRREHLEKATFASLTATFLTLTLLMAVLPSAIAHSGDTMYAPPASVIPTIDGNWTAGEWADAPQYNITGYNITSPGYVRVKYDANFLYIIIDSVWDPTLNATWGVYEGTYVAFDTAHDGGTAPQPDDYLFYNAYSRWMNAWKGDGTTWEPLYQTGFMGEQGLSASPNNATAHRIDEMRIPLAYVDTSTGGFYVIVRDDDSDPDWQGPAPPTVWVEWPTEAGGNPNGWPQPGPTYRGDPCPAPNAWGDLTFAAPAVGGVVTPVDKLALLAPYIALAIAIIAAIISIVYIRKR